MGDKRYHLTQLHFHRPREEYIRDKPNDMEVHLVDESGDGKVAGVTVLLKAGLRERHHSADWDHMPKTEGKEEEIPGAEINPAGLLPRGVDYYGYVGSLTAPLRTEHVIWFVLKTPVDVSSEEINEFARLYPHDVRPLQRLNGTRGEGNVRNANSTGSGPRPLPNHNSGAAAYHTCGGVAEPRGASPVHAPRRT